MEETFCPIDALRQALTNIASYSPEADPDVESRAKALLVVAAVLTFFRGYPEIEKHLSPLVELQIALQDVQNGRPVPWLMPKKRPGQPPTTIETATLRGRYAAVTDLLMNAGWTEGQAARFVAEHGAVERLMPQERRRRAAPDEIVRSWRTQAMGNSGSGNYDRVRAGFEYQRGLFSDDDMENAEKVALVWLTGLQKI